MTLEEPELKLALADMGSGYEDLLLALRDELRRDERAGALFVVGSTAVGEADRYSDLDLLIVARSGEGRASPSS